MSVSSLCVAFYGLVVRERPVKAVYRPTNQSVAWMPLPLSSVHVAAQVFDFCSEVTVTQLYANPTPHLFESEYIFPLDENSAVCAFSAEVDGRLIHGLVKEKSAARKEFVAAKARGQSTMLLEQAQENVFKISIGNIKPHSECKIKLTYITTLDLEGKANRLVIPSVVAPRYQPGAYYGYNGHLLPGGTGPLNGFNGQPSTTIGPSAGSSFFQSVTSHYRSPPVLVPATALTVSSKQQTAAPQRFSMQIEVLMPSEIVGVASESHPNQIHVQLDPVVGVVSEADQRLSVPHHATIRFGMNADGSEPSVWPESLGQRDFVLTFTQRAYLEARAVLEVDPATGSQAVQLAFCPQSLDLMDASSLQVELIFLIDQSGSMSGSGIAAVRSCLATFLRSLPVACKFNLVSFGNSYRSLFPSSKRYSEKTINQALEYAANIQADLGGTEILPPLQHCFEASRSADYPRQIFLLTDGQVSNTQQLVDLTREHAHHTRLFTFGLGNSVDRHLVKSLAAAGRGECEFVSGGANQELCAKVMRNLVRAMQPSLQDVRVDWSAVPGAAPAASREFLSNSLQQCPEQIAPIFPPNREIIYALLAGGAQAAAIGQPDQIVNLVVSAHSNRQNGDSIQGRVQWSIPLNLSKPQMGTFVHRLAARARIGEIQNWTNRHHRWSSQKNEVLKLAIKYQLLSNFTAFIIVDDRKVSKKAKARRVTRSTPAAASAQANMFNAYLSAQTQPGAQINANGFAFQDVSNDSAQMDEDDDEDASSGCDSDEEYTMVTLEADYGRARRESGGMMGGMMGGSRGGRGGSRGGSGGGRGGRGGSRGGSSALSYGGASGEHGVLAAYQGSPSAGLSRSSMSDRDEPAKKRKKAAMPVAAPAAASSRLLSSSISSSVNMSQHSAAAPRMMRKEMAYESTECEPAMDWTASRSRSRSASRSRSPVRSSSSSASPASLFPVLVQMSCIDGTWNLSEEFLSLVKQIASSAGQASSVSHLSVSSFTTLASSLGLSSKVLATLVALWCLRACFAQRQDEWAMMAGKAKGALRNGHKVPIDQIDQITSQILQAA